MGQLGEAGAGVPVWFPLHLMGEDMRAPQALLWAGCWAQLPLCKAEPTRLVLEGRKGPYAGPVLALHPDSSLALALLSQPGMCCEGERPHCTCVLGMEVSPQHWLCLLVGQVGSALGRAGTGTPSTQVLQSVPAPLLPTPCPAPYLGLNVQNSNFVLLVDLVHCFKLGAKHVSLVASKLQELIG